MNTKLAGVLLLLAVVAGVANANTQADDMLEMVVDRAKRAVMRRHRRSLEGVPPEMIVDEESLAPLERVKRRELEQESTEAELERVKRFRRTVAGKDEQEVGKVAEDKDKKNRGHRDHQRQAKTKKNVQDKHTKKNDVPKKDKKHAMDKKDTENRNIHGKKTNKEHQKAGDKKRNVIHHQSKHHKSKKPVSPSEHHISKRFAGIVKRAVHRLTRSNRDPIGHLNHPKELQKGLNEHAYKKGAHKSRPPVASVPATGHSRMKRFRRALNHEISKRVLHAHTHKRKMATHHKQKKNQ